MRRLSFDGGRFQCNESQLQRLYLMKANLKFLPRLNLCYLQKKAYEIHLRKVNNIKRSNPQPPLSEPFVKYKTHSISPYCRRTMQQAERENERLFQAIENCHSTINRKGMSKDCECNRQLLSRICKFTTGENKSELKSKISLQKLKIKSLTPKVKLQNVSSKGSQYLSAKIKQKLLEKRAEIEGLMLRRNKSKVNQHASRNQLSLRSKQRLEGFRQNLSNSSKMHLNPIYRWKTRCFTTQPDEQHSL